MSRLEPLARDAISADLQEVIARAEGTFGFTPNSLLTMARKPELLRAFQALSATVFAPGLVPAELKTLVAHMASRAAGCTYCSAHSAYLAGHARGPGAAERMDAVWEFETSPLFTPAERAALRVAVGAGLTPNAVSDDDFAELRRHYSDLEAIEIVSVIAMFGFLNRWNDTLATDLEESTSPFALIAT